MSTEQNRYRAPASELDTPVDLSQNENASKLRRFVGFVIDYAGFVLFGAVFGFAIAIAFGDEGVRQLQRIPDLLLGTGLFFVYYLFFEGVWARTPGKLITSTMVITDEGVKPRWTLVAKRTALRFIPFEGFSFFGKRGFHDKHSNTRVVLLRKS